LPPVPAGSSRSRNIRAWRGPGWTTVTEGCSSQESTSSKAAAMESGLGNRFGLVVRRRKASRTTHDRPTVSDPEIAISHQDLAWRAAANPD
jgi:hypothetical protein